MQRSTTTLAPVDCLVKGAAAVLKEIVSQHCLWNNTTPAPVSYPTSDASTPSNEASVITAVEPPIPKAKRMASTPTRETPLPTMSVPATRISRVTTFGTTIAKVGWMKTVGPKEEGMIPKAGHQLLASTLCRMRGAVLKLGQMLSIQDDNTVPASVSAMFQQVRDSAFAMPPHQLDQAMTEGMPPLQLADNSDVGWRQRFVGFQDEPLAAASIGQVHYAVLPSSCSLALDRLSDLQTEGEGVPVAVKVQYPGVAQSIDSDVANLKMLMKWNFLPPGLFVGNILAELRQELKQECLYTLEAAKQKRYRSHLEADPVLSRMFYVPAVFDTFTSNTILTTEFVQGVPIDKVARARASTNQSLTAWERNLIGESLMRLTLTELFDWRFMQTDPNYSNFLIESTPLPWSRSGLGSIKGAGILPKAQELPFRINLLDFGAAREYDEGFVRDYLDVVEAAMKQDRRTIVEKSIALGFLTGKECKEMLEAHTESVLILGKPFRGNQKGGEFDFTLESLPKQLQSLVPVMLKLRLRPPPTPVYSLHRRLSGTILLSTLLGSNYAAGELLLEISAKAREQLSRQQASPEA